MYLFIFILPKPHKSTHKSYFTILLRIKGTLISFATSIVENLTLNLELLKVPTVYKMLAHWKVFGSKIYSDWTMLVYPLLYFRCTKTESICYCQR